MDDRDKTLKAFYKKYDRIYDPVANAAAIDELNEKIARRIKMKARYPEKG